MKATTYTCDHCLQPIPTELGERAFESLITVTHHYTPTTLAVYRLPVPERHFCSYAHLLAFYDKHAAQRVKGATNR